MPNIENISLAPQMCSLSISKFLSSSGFVMSRATDPHLPCCERLQSVSSPFHSEIGSLDTGIHLLWLLKKKITSKSKNVVTKAEACCQRMILYVCAAGRSCALLCYATSDRWSLDVVQWVVKHLLGGSRMDGFLEFWSCLQTLSLLVHLTRPSPKLGNRILDIPKDLCDML